MEVHHIGYLVKNIKKALPAFQILGYVKSSAGGGGGMFDTERQAYICFLQNGPCRIELIEPLQGSTLYPLLKKYNNAPYHICYRCDNLEEAAEMLKKEKYMLFLPPAPAPAIGKGARVAFLMSARAGMIELLEEKI